MKKAFYSVFAVVTALVFWGCATGKPLHISDLDEVGWGNTANFQCYLSSAVTLERFPDDSSVVSFDKEGAAYVRDSRATIKLAVSLEGRVVNYSKRDQCIYVAFEDGEASLPFANKDGRFVLMTTVDNKFQNGAEFVEYEGFKYKPTYVGKAPFLNVVINRSQSDLRRQMQGSQVRSVIEFEEAVKLACEKFIEGLGNGLPEGITIAVMGVSSKDTENAIFVTEELQHQLADAGKFTVVDRSVLNKIYEERNFQYFSGDVDEDSMISLGRVLGASVIVLGDINGTGSSRRLNIKALDVETDEILVSVREPL
jgi:TolB-like protein